MTTLSVDDSENISLSLKRTLAINLKKKNVNWIRSEKSQQSGFRYHYHILTLTHWGRDKMTAISQHFMLTFLNENFLILNKISLKYVPRCLIDNMTALVQTMAWCWPGAKPLPEPMLIILLMHICVTRPHWVNPYRQNTASVYLVNINSVNSLRPCDSYMQTIISSDNGLLPVQCQAIIRSCLIT